jgi:hypothetical protein
MNDFTSEEKTKVYGNTNPHPCFYLKIARSSCDQAAIKLAAVYLNYFSVRQQQQTSQTKRSVSQNQQQQNWFGDNTEQKRKGNVEKEKRNRMGLYHRTSS